MRIVRNNIIPIKGFAAVNLFGVIFARKGARLTDKLIRHEEIHTAQMRETLYLPFYALYFVEWVIRLFLNPGEAYKNVSFEREAYANQGDAEYLKKKKTLRFFDVGFKKIWLK